MSVRLQAPLTSDVPCILPHVVNSVWLHEKSELLEPPNDGQLMKLFSGNLR